MLGGNETRTGQKPDPMVLGSVPKFRLYSKAVAQKTIPQKSHVVRFQFQKDHTLVEWSGARPERETNGGDDGSAAEQLGKLAWGVCRHRFDASSSRHKVGLSLTHLLPQMPHPRATCTGL